MLGLQLNDQEKQGTEVWRRLDMRYSSSKCVVYIEDQQVNPEDMCDLMTVASLCNSDLAANSHKNIYIYIYMRPE